MIVKHTDCYFPINFNNVASCLFKQDATADTKTDALNYCSQVIGHSQPFINVNRITNKVVKYILAFFCVE